MFFVALISAKYRGDSEPNRASLNTGNATPIRSWMFFFIFASLFNWICWKTRFWGVHSKTADKNITFTRWSPTRVLQWQKKCGEIAGIHQNQLKLHKLNKCCKSDTPLDCSTSDGLLKVSVASGTYCVAVSLSVTVFVNFPSVTDSSKSLEIIMGYPASR